jgi:hypothetical protein
MLSSAPKSTTTIQPGYLCFLCKSFWERATCLHFNPKDLHRGGDAMPSMPQHILHTHRRSKIASAASLGCHFCAIIIGVIAGCTGDHSGRAFTDQNRPIYISLAVMSEDDSIYLLTFFDRDQDRIFSHNQVLNSHPLLLRPTKGMSHFSILPNQH